MQFQIQIVGPAFTRTVTLDASGAPLIVGRDASASLHLPDPERSISRKHVSLHCETTPVPGVLVTVLSAVSGVSSSRGEIAPGQTLLLRGGDSLQVGSYSLAFSDVAGRTTAATQPSRADDPFAALGLGNIPMATHQDPFEQLEIRATPAPTTSADDPFQALMGFGNPSASDKPSFSGVAKQGPSGAPSSNAGDPMAIFSPVSVGAPVNTINDWLGNAGSSSLGGLGASSMLTGLSPAAPSTLARDHVHDIHLPLQLPDIASVNKVAAPSIAAAPPKQDGWAKLQGDWPNTQPDSATLSPAPFGRPILPSNQPVTSPSNSGWKDFGDSWLDKLEPTSGESPWHTPPPLPATRSKSSGGAADPAALTVLGDSPFTPPALEAFCKGLGIAKPDEINSDSWVKMGNAVRLIVEGLADLMNARAELKRELRSEERTMLHSRNNNPLKAGMSTEGLLQYLLFTGTGAGGFMPTDRALKESVDELRAHDLATVTATRAAVEGALRDFDPEKLKTVLNKGKKGNALMPQFLDRSRLWESYEEHYGKRSEHMADWLEQMFNRHFMPAYSKETERLKRLARQNGPE